MSLGQTCFGMRLFFHLVQCLLQQPPGSGEVVPRLATAGAAVGLGPTNAGWRGGSEGQPVPGRVYSLVNVRARMASRTPSFTPSPESPIPPKGVSSVR